MIDGKPYANPSAFDADFESSTPRGFYVGGQGYQVQIDAKNAHTGRQSLKIEQTSEAAASQSNLQLCRGVLDDMEAWRSKFLKAGASQKEIEWAIQNARLVVQYEELKVEGQVRDRAMAENLEWIADQNPGAKIVVWAHNGHVSYQEQSMGGYLKRYFGAQIVNFGFVFDQGSFRAFDPKKRQIATFTLNPAPESTWESALGAANIPLFALDLRRAPFAPETAAWMQEQHRTRSLGAVYDESEAENYWYPTQLQDEFDAIFFVQRTTASHGLPF
jgi:erythromycin esterase